MSAVLIPPRAVQTQARICFKVSRNERGFSIFSNCKFVLLFDQTEQKLFIMNNGKRTIRATKQSAIFQQRRIHAMRKSLGYVIHQVYVF